MNKKYLIQLLCLLCAVCFSAGGVTLFASGISDQSASFAFAGVSSSDAYNTMAVVSDSSAQSKSASSHKTSSKSVSSKVSSAVSSAASVRTSSKPKDYIEDLNDKSQDIPSAVKNKDVSSSSRESSKTSSKSVSSRKTSSKAPALTSSKTTASEAASSKTTSSGGTTNDEIIYLSVNGEVKEYSALDAVALNVAAEMDDSFEKEAIKAQAVAAHTYMVYTNSCGKAPVLPIRTPSANIKKLVKSVINKLIYYNSKPINAVYFATSGGDTASAADIWGAEIPYLKSVESKYDNLVKNYKTTKVYSNDDFKAIIKKNAGISLSGNSENWIKILNHGDGGYVGKMTIGGKKKATVNGSSRTIIGNLFRESILNYGIRSPKFEFAVGDDEITFTSYGYGHCVGLSQDGANMYAKKDGRGYAWILKHYYSGVTVK